MFIPTHLLVTRAKKTPVQLIPCEQGFKIVTEIEAQRGSEPLFEMRNKLGFFCQGISVVGYSLEPIESGDSQVSNQVSNQASNQVSGLETSSSVTAA
jgi:hypothetical protein